MGEEGTPPFRVLDLACGDGLLRAAVAQRVPTREIHYTGIDSNRVRLRRFKIPRIDPHRDPRARPGRLQERLIPAELDLHDPKRLATQLRALLGDEQFDEVHVHLLHPREHGRQPTGPRVLRAIARYLRPGGRLYHLFQTSSPLFDFKPDRILLPRATVRPSAGTAGGVLGANEQRFREGASKAGLLLDKCGHRWWKGMSERESRVTPGAGSLWLTRRFAWTKPDRRTAETYDRLVEQYSGFSAYATHFVILRKPRKSGVGLSICQPGV